MSMSVSLHAKERGELELECKIVTHNGNTYPVLSFDLNTSDGFQDVTIFPSFEKVKELYVKLGELVREIDLLEFSEDCEAKEEFETDEQDNKRTMQRSIPDSAF
jgi:hypothetical protein